jgi:cysteinyl-tRNA synthetase
MYTCGPTVYAPQHIGNLRSQLFADLVKRTLLLEGYQVTHVINVTDVGHLTDDADAGEDKVELAAARAGLRAEEIAAQHTEQWERDRARIGCLAPEVLCHATHHIEEQIDLARRLEDNGFTYQIEDGLYFDTSKFARYAEFAALDLEQQVGGARIGDVAGKRHAADFALWKRPPPLQKRQQEWDSPWGRGFPGWHLECSAMSIRYLGPTFDIHTGGVDHVPVHHTNEVAQSECAYGVQPWVRFWLHNEFLLFDRGKMAKSEGNVLVLDELIERGFEPLALRYFFLQAHYRQQQTYTDEAMEAADVGYRRLLSHAAEVREASEPLRPQRTEAHRQRFLAELRDDLNAPRALAVAWDVARSAELSPAERRALLHEFDAVLGLDLRAARRPEERQEKDLRIDGLLAEREEARRRRDFAAADRIRQQLVAEGILVEDTPEGPRWRRER